MVDDVTTFESSFEPIGEGRTQRMDVIPSGMGRRYWTPEAKARIIAESMAGGVIVADIARRNDLLPQQLYAWRRAAAERMEANGQPAFVPAVIDECRPLAANNVPALGSATLEIGIDLCGMTIRVPDGASADHIERVLLAVRVAP